MNKLVKWILIGGLLSTAIVGNWLYTPHLSDKTSHRDIHYHAGFKVYINGDLQDYSDYRFMNFVPCTKHDTKKSKAEEQIEKAHLHDGVGDVVHIHREGAVWGDLFKNIGVELPRDLNIKGYINGEEVENIMQRKIEAYSTTIFVIGEKNASHENEMVSVDHIKEVERKSELCGKGE